MIFADLECDIQNRIIRLQQNIMEMGADGCVVSSGINIFYLTGVIYVGYVYVPAEGDIIHFVKRPHTINFRNTVYIRKPEQLLEELNHFGIDAPQKVLIETDAISYSEGNRLIKALGVKEVYNASVLLRNIRSRKSAFELEQIRLCARRHEEVYKTIPSLYRRGMTDIELQIEIEKQMRLHGSMGIFRAYGENMDVFMGSLLVGANAEEPTPFEYALGGAGVSPTLPLGASGIKIEEGNSIMVDMAGNYTPWMTDMTRVFAVGEISPLSQKAHKVSIEIQNEIINMVKPGIECSQLYNKAMDIVKKNSLEDYFMGTKQQAKFIGHGVGLEINEPPVLTSRSKERLEVNTVFALEPKFVIPGTGAVGIENTFLVTSTGLEKLTLFEEGIIYIQ